MAQARETLDKLTAAMVSKDFKGLAKCYAADAVAMTPDKGEVKGREEIVEWFRQFADAFPDATWDPIGQYEMGDCAIDEGYLIGTHTGPLALPTGDVAPTGKRVRLREADIAVVSDGLVREHRFYYDELEFMEQLGLAPA